MDEFPSNSHSQQSKPTPQPAPKKNAETKKVEQIVTGEVIRRKKPLGARLKETLIGGNAKGVWGYVTMDVLIPAARDMVVDAGTQALERMVFGESRRRSGVPFRGGYTPYNRMGAQSTGNSAPWRANQTEPREVSRQARSMHNFDEILLPSRGEAEEVIDQLIEIVSQYQSASVSDLYAMVGITPSYTDNKYGWTDLRGANVQHVRGGGYLLNLPKPNPLD